MAGIFRYVRTISRLHDNLITARTPTVAGVVQLHSSSAYHIRGKSHEEMEKQLITKQTGYFNEAAEKAAVDKKTFKKAIAVYMHRQRVHRRGHVEFIYAALKKMKEFGVEKNLDAYKTLMDVFPKEKMIARNNIQVEMMHYPKQQQCAIDLLDQMEYHGVIPDDEFGYMILNVFGKDTHTMRKYQRMMYWLPKFKNINPWPIPKTLPTDPTELARLALSRMAVDLQNKLAVFWTDSLEAAVDKTWIVSAQSPEQQELVNKHKSVVPLFVEGGFHVWAREKNLTYFCLRADPDSDRVTEIKESLSIEEEKEKGLFDADKWKLFFEEEDVPSQVMKRPSVHEQDDGTILALCITGTGSKDSLRSWVKLLQSANPNLRDTPVVFRLTTPEEGIQVLNEEKEKAVRI